MLKETIPHQSLKQININGNLVDIKAVHDDSPSMKDAYKLWYDVYMDELKYDLHELVDHEQRTLGQTPNGSIVFLAYANTICIGTLVATYEAFSMLEYDYSELLPNKKIAQLSRLITNKKYRKTELTAQILIACSDFNLQTGNHQYCDTIVVNCTQKLLPYYYLFGFRSIANKTITHPYTKNRSYLMQCSYETNESVVQQMRKLVKGNKMMRLKWSIKYWWLKNVKFKK